MARPHPAGLCSMSPPPQALRGCFIDEDELVFSVAGKVVCTVPPAPLLGLFFSHLHDARPHLENSETRQLNESLLPPGNRSGCSLCPASGAIIPALSCAAIVTVIICGSPNERDRGRTGTGQARSPLIQWYDAFALQYSSVSAGLSGTWFRAPQEMGPLSLGEEVACCRPVAQWRETEPCSINLGKRTTLPMTPRFLADQMERRADQPCVTVELQQVHGGNFRGEHDLELQRTKLTCEFGVFPSFAYAHLAPHRPLWVLFRRFENKVPKRLIWFHSRTVEYLVLRTDRDVTLWTEETTITNTSSFLSGIQIRRNHDFQLLLVFGSFTLSIVSSPHGEMKQHAFSHSSLPSSSPSSFSSSCLVPMPAPPPPRLTVSSSLSGRTQSVQGRSRPASLPHMAASLSVCLGSRTHPPGRALFAQRTSAELGSAAAPVRSPSCQTSLGGDRINGDVLATSRNTQLIETTNRAPGFKLLFTLNPPPRGKLSHPASSPSSPPLARLSPPSWHPQAHLDSQSTLYPNEGQREAPGALDGDAQPPQHSTPRNVCDSAQQSHHDASTITDLCSNLPELEIVSLLSERQPKYTLRADTVFGYDSDDWLHTPLVPPEVVLGLTYEQIEETFKYFFYAEGEQTAEPDGRSDIMMIGSERLKSSFVSKGPELDWSFAPSSASPSPFLPGSPTWPGEWRQA
ncbi:hypothetical protein CCH79_00012721 [Gambusia affinis]|uniref:HAP1 N-terminal domain-containing protein n=1 Tax=Gambusia affinis TaxID=33528 RepID=A0A315V2F0_GAMAF|nr:hypothetical protein CCH79_00012721 [Gambusia affinis]